MGVGVQFTDIRLEFHSLTTERMMLLASPPPFFF